MNTNWPHIHIKYKEMSCNNIDNSYIPEFVYGKSIIIRTGFLDYISDNTNTLRKIHFKKRTHDSRFFILGYFYGNTIIPMVKSSSISYPFHRSTR